MTMTRSSTVYTLQASGIEARMGRDTASPLAFTVWWFSWTLAELQPLAEARFQLAGTKARPRRSAFASSLPLLPIPLRGCEGLRTQIAGVTPKRRTL